MRIVGLISGGKDSVFNMLHCISAGHEIVAVANIEPAGRKDELDSYMYQTVGHHTLSLFAAAMCLPIFRRSTKGIAICKEKTYVATEKDEVEDLFMLLSQVKDEMHIDGVSVGSIESDYQRTRVENVCSRLNLKCFAFLWKRNQEELLQEMIDADINAVIVKVATIGLTPEIHLGMSIKDLQPTLLELNRKFGVNICGEGGEYETLTIDCPLYHRRIEVNQTERIVHSDNAFAAVGYLNIKNATLETKVWADQTDEEESTSGKARYDYINRVVKSPLYYVQDCLDEAADEVYTQNKEGIWNEVLPFPFSAPLKSTESRNFTVDQWLKKPSGSLQTNQTHPQMKRTVTFSPSSVIPIDTAMTQLNLSTGWCCIGNVAAPTIKDGLTIIQTHLERYQYGYRDIVSIALYVRDLGDWPKMNKTYSQILPSVCPPARICVAVPLPNDVGVAFTVVAHRLVSKTQKVVHHTQHTVDRDCVHVQSISHWAPANIGPYCQCVRVGQIVYVAGQIPLVPGTMELLSGPILQQCRLALRHVSRILASASENYTIANVMHGICFAVSEVIAVEMTDMWNFLTKNEHAVIAAVVVSALPKAAEFEWQVVACGYDDPQVTSTSETISEEILFKCKRCFYPNHNTSSLVCNVSFLNYSYKKDKKVRTVTSETVLYIMKQCLQILRGDIVGSGTPLCMFNVFFKASETLVALTVNETFKTSLDFKVVITCIPVVACSEPSVFLTITGVCH